MVAEENVFLYLSHENNKLKVPEQMDVSKGGKRVRLTIGVKPEDDPEEKKRGTKWGAEVWHDVEV